MLVNAGLVILGYLCGSVASAVMVSRLLGRPDPRSAGSGNPGVTNVLRLHGKAAAILTLAGDVLKAVLPVTLAKFLGAPAAIIALTGGAAFVGHLYPVFFGFRGGKGVATLIGVLVAVYWPLGLAYVVTWIAVAVAFRYSSVAALSAAALTPIYTWLLVPETAYLACFTALALLLVYRHRSNIRHLLDGTEDKIGAP